MKSVPSWGYDMFVLNREKNGNRPCSVCICLARGSRRLVAAGSGPQQRVSHDVDDGSERLTSPRRVTIDASASGEPPILTLDAALSPHCGIASHLGLTQLHRRCLGLAFGASASVWVSPCGTVSFPSSYDRWGRSAHRCPRRLHDLPVEGHQRRRFGATHDLH